jgi:hypothetical protein
VVEKNTREVSEGGAVDSCLEKKKIGSTNPPRPARPEVLYVSTDLRLLRVGDLGADVMPPAVWGQVAAEKGEADKRSERNRYCHRLTPALLSEVRRQVDALERRWAAGQYPGEKAAVVARRWSAIEEWVAEHGLEDEGSEAGAAGEAAKETASRQAHGAGRGAAAVGAQVLRVANCRDDRGVVPGPAGHPGYASAPG